MKNLLIVCLIFILVACAPSQVAIQTAPTFTPIPVSTPTRVPLLQVGGSGQFSTIQAAIDAANNGNTIQVAQGKYTENIKINRSINILIQGGWSADFQTRSDDNTLTVIDGSGRESVVNIFMEKGAESTIRLEDLTLQNGKTKDGGAVQAAVGDKDSKLTLELNNNLITRNIATNNGGGINLDGGRGSITATLSGNLISENVTTYAGGGIRVSADYGGTADVTLTRNVITLNGVRGLSKEEGGLGVDWGGGIDGGGIAAYAGSGGKVTMLLKNNLITRNRGEYGGGIFGYAFGTDSLLTYTLTNNIIANNENGGGIFSCSGKTDPVGPTGGSVIWNLSNNTITGNTAKTFAGGVGAFSGSDFGDGGNITISSRNDIIWGNTDPQGNIERTPQIAVGIAPGKTGSASASATYSLIGQSWTGGGGTYFSDHVLDKDPRFADPIHFNFLLQDDSPAIDAGDPDSAYNDSTLPPGKGTERNDMGAYGGPNNGNWSH